MICANSCSFPPPILEHQCNEKWNEQNCCRTLCPLPPHRSLVSVTRHSTFHLQQCFLRIDFLHNINCIRGKIKRACICFAIRRFSSDSLIHISTCRHSSSVATPFTITWKQFFYRISICFIHICFYCLYYKTRENRKTPKLKTIFF